MTKININTNREEVSSEEIKGRRDFSKLIANYKAVSKPFYKSTYFIAGMSLVTAVGIFSVFYFTKQSTPVEVMVNESTKIVTKRPFINPAFSNLDITFETMSVQAESGGTLKLKNGSIIKIPKNAFKDEKGNQVSGKVDIRYREFRDAIDMLVSGIPMQYDSVGPKSQLESAGMFEIQGVQNGKTIALTKDIVVEMASTNFAGNFNQYFLDTVSRTWKYLGRDKIVKDKNKVDLASENDFIMSDTSADFNDNGFGDNSLTVYQNKVQSTKENINALKKEEPVKPIKTKVQNYHFDLDVLPSEFPELTDYRGLQFEVGPENKSFNEKLYAIVWDDVKLNYNTPGKNYKIAFVKDGKTSEFVVYPVYQGKDSVKVMALYQTKFKTYEKKLNERILAEKKAKEEYELQQKKWEEERIAEQKRYEAEQKKYAEEALKKSSSIDYSNIRNAFTVNQFGIYNSDCPFRFSNEVTMKISFTNENGKPLQVDIAYHIDAKRNTLFSHYYGNSKAYTFNYDQKSRNTLFSVSSKNELWVFSTEDFKTVSPAEGKYTFKMKKSDKTFKTVQGLRDYLLVKGN